MKIKTYIFFSVIIITLFILLAFEKAKKRKPKIINHYEYVTDTVLSNKYKKLKLLYDKKTPPKTIIKWKTPPTKVDDISITQLKDSLVLVYTELQEKKLYIANNFLKLYPSSDKLIEFNLSKDSLDITTLNIKGNISTQIYPLYLDNYKYQWLDNTLHNSKYKKLKSHNKFDLSQLYLNIGYDYLNKYNSLALDYHINFGRLLLGTNYKMISNKINDNVQLEFRIGYRLLK